MRDGGCRVGAVMLMVASISDGSFADSMLNPIIYLAGIIFITVSVGVIFDTVRKYRAFRKSEEENCERLHPPRRLKPLEPLTVSRHLGM